MIATHKITMDLARNIGKYIPPIDVMQDDKYSRDIEFTIKSDGSDLILSNHTALIRFKKADGTGGNYDTLPDGNPAYSIEGNVVTISLAPQVCTAVGKVELSVAIISSSGKSYLHTFSVTLNVRKNPGLQPFSENYLKITGAVPDYGWPANMSLGTDEDGRVVAFEKVDSPGLRGTPDSANYNRLSAKLNQGFYLANKNDWDDLPGDENDTSFALLVFWYTKNYNVQVAYSIPSNMAAYRMVNASTGAVYKDWCDLGAQMRKISDPAQYDGVLAKVVRDGVYGVSAAEWNDWPLATSGPLFVFSFNDNYVMQTAASIEGGEMQTRIVNKKTNEIYRDWFSVGVSWIKANASDYENKMSNLTKDGAYYIGKSEWIDNPTSEGGALLVFRYTTNYVLQIFVSVYGGTITTRIVNRTDKTVYRDWTGSGVDPVNILVVGDSIARGYRNGGKGFVGDLGFPYKNAAVSGATISNKNTQYTNIPDQLTGVTDYDPDVIIANGGINDYTQSAPMGDVPTSFVKTDEEAELLNRDTVLGALEYLFYKMLSLYPRAQRYFLLIHKVTRETGVDCTITKNAAGYTQTELFEAIRKVCALYNVKIIDVFNKSVINTAYEEYRSPVSYADDNTVTDREFVDKDGVHPLAYGYIHGYLPVVKQALQGGGEVGAGGERGADGYTPKKGVDYYTEDDRAEIIDDVLHELTSGIVMRDQNADKCYAIYVSDGKLAMKECAMRSGASNGITMIDRTTGVSYIIYVSAGKLTMRESEE